MPPMRRIGIDCRFAGTTSGLGRYTREIVSRLVNVPSDCTYVLFLAPGDGDWLPSSPKCPVKRVSVGIRHYSLGEQLLLPSIYRKAKLDLLFVPHFNVPYFCPVPAIVTIHDLILHRFPNQASLPRQIVYKILMKRAVTKAKRIIAVSGFTAREIGNAYGRIVAGKTEIVHEGVSSFFHPVSAADAKPVLAKHGITRPYFLYVGNAKEHKNVPMLLEAFASSGRLDCDLLLITGGEEAEELVLPPHARLVSNVPEADLPALYSSALACVTASLYEGFGLPLFEAAACGCPIIGTRCGALPEIAPIGSLIIDPSLSALTAALHSPPARRSALSPMLPTWDVAAKKTNVILQAALEDIVK